VRAWLADQTQAAQAEFQVKFKPAPSPEGGDAPVEDTVAVEAEESGDAATEF